MKEIKRVFIHIRWPLQSFTLLGFLFGITIAKTELSLEVILGFISWLLLCSAIAVFNSYYDKDEKPVAGLASPPPAARSMLIGAWLMKSAGLIIGVLLNTAFLVSYLFTLIITVLYSHEKFRLKSNGYLAVSINFLVGAATFSAAASFSPLDVKLLAFGSMTEGLFLAAIYLMMQVHQKVEDKDRGDISIMVLYGRTKTILFATTLIAVAGLFTIYTLANAGYDWKYLVTASVYFIVILLLSYRWWKKKANANSDYIFMNKLTMRLSYAAIIILLIMYSIKTLF